VRSAPRRVAAQAHARVPKGEFSARKHRNFLKGRGLVASGREQTMLLLSAHHSSLADDHIYGAILVAECRETKRRM
jgi:hypothetical protein